MEDDLKWKMTSYGRWPLEGRWSEMEDNLKWKMTSNGRQTQMEDNLKWKTTSDGKRPPQIKGECLHLKTYKI